jgi:hypothetical protein
LQKSTKRFLVVRATQDLTPAPSGAEFHHAVYDLLTLGLIIGTANCPVDSSWLAND